MTQDHTIQKLRLELRLPRELGAYELQQQVAKALQDVALPLMEKELDAFCGEGEVVRIDQLRLDLGHLTIDRLSTDLVEALVSKLRLELSTKFSATMAGPDASGVKRADATTALRTQLRAQLGTGRLDWSSDLAKGSLAQLIGQLIETSPETARQDLRQLLRLPNVPGRLAKQLPREVRDALLALLSRQPREAVAKAMEVQLALLEAVSGLLRKPLAGTALRREIAYYAWVLGLQDIHLLVAAPPAYAIRQFLRLVGRLEGLVPGELDELVGLSGLIYPAVAPWAEAVKAQLYRSPSEAFARLLSQAVHKELLHAIVQGSGLQRFTSSLATDLQERLAHEEAETQAHFQAWCALPMLIGAAQGRLLSIEAGNDPRQLGNEAGNNALAGDSLEGKANVGGNTNDTGISLDHLPGKHEGKKKNGNEIDDETPFVYNQEKDAMDVDSILEKQSQVFGESHEKKIASMIPLTGEMDTVSLAWEKDGSIYVDNAGLVMLHPFLKYIFEDMGWMESGRFVDADAQEDAVMLCAYIGSGELGVAEARLPLAKLICGMDLLQPVRFQVDLPDDVLLESDNMLRAAADHWKRAGKLEPSGFRETFLQREGRLTPSEMGWSLKVDRKTVDILLDFLPWGFATIKLPWMQQIITVDW